MRQLRITLAFDETAAAAGLLWVDDKVYGPANTPGAAGAVLQVQKTYDIVFPVWVRKYFRCSTRVGDKVQAPTACAGGVDREDDDDNDTTEASTDSLSLESLLDTCAHRTPAETDSLLNFCEDARKWLSSEEQTRIRTEALEKRRAALRDKQAVYSTRMRRADDSGVHRYTAEQTAAGSAPESAMNPGQKKQVAALAKAVLDCEIWGKEIESYVSVLRDAPVEVQMRQVRSVLRKQCNMSLDAAHHYLAFHLGCDAPGAHDVSFLVASWLTPAGMIDEDVTFVLEQVLDGLAKNDWAKVAISQGLVVAADGANAKVLYEHLDGIKYLGDVFADAHTDMRTLIDETLRKNN